MISFFEASMAELSVHRIGNKSQDEFYVLSEQSIELKENLLRNLLQQYFLSPFEKTNEVYRFFHPNTDLNLNEVYHFAAEIFDNGEKFHNNSKELAKYLYDVSGHPKIKAGELYVAFFENVQIDGEFHDAI
jgi:hypothetical protein